MWEEIVLKWKKTNKGQTASPGSTHETVQLHAVVALSDRDIDSTLAGSRTRINCLEGSLGNRYTTHARTQACLSVIRTLVTLLPLHFPSANRPTTEEAAAAPCSSIWPRLLWVLILSQPQHRLLRLQATSVGATAQRSMLSVWVGGEG